MTTIKAYPGKKITGIINLPGDKSISHRAILLSSIAKGASFIRDCSVCNDCLASINAIKSLGIDVEQNSENELRIHGKGMYGYLEPEKKIYCDRSGTTIRLLAGLLAGQRFNCELNGDPQLLRRPMTRISEPLKNMGADIRTTEGFAPIQIYGSVLKGYKHKLSIASAQVKSAIILAGLYAESTTSIQQPGRSRNHTEKMLQDMGADLDISNDSVTIKPATSLKPIEISVPGDISSAVFPIAAGLLTDNSEVICKDVGINHTRTGLIDVLKEMGAEIKFINARSNGNEPVADIIARSSSLKGIEVSGETVVRMIDEFPIFAFLATQANGKTVVKNAKELRVKETDRIKTVATELQKLGANITTYEDGFEINGPARLNSSDTADSHGDHRLAMALVIASLVADKPLVINNVDCISDSYPNFIESMQSLGAKYD